MLIVMNIYIYIFDMHNSILIPCYEAKVHCMVMLSGVH